MPDIKTIAWTALILLIIFAVLDFFNKTAYLLLPVTTVKGLISGKPDSTVATLNSPATN